jgi:lactoylglutathione lyase
MPKTDFMTSISQWTLWRQDDNGSSAIISKHLAKSDAESKLAELESRGHKQHYWIEPDNDPATPPINLVVIRSKDIDASKAFYEMIGLNFTRHKHGVGAEHYACESPSGVFEIYPELNESSAGARIGFSVHSADDSVSRLKDGGYDIIGEPKDSPWGRRAIARDPDGHSVEITSPTKSARILKPATE